MTIALDFKSVCTHERECILVLFQMILSKLMSIWYSHAIAWMADKTVSLEDGEVNMK